jgi:hypothetical protein
MLLLKAEQEDHLMKWDASLIPAQSWPKNGAKDSLFINFIT